MQEFVVVHGGVDMPPTAQTIAALEDAGLRGFESATGSLSAVVEALASLEDDPQFNAGYGSVLNEAGDVEVDAGIVHGTLGRIGAVGAVPGLRHPARVAAALLREAGGAVFLTGDGARRFADSLGHPHEDLRTADQIAVWEALRRGEDLSPFTGVALASNSETVGAIAFQRGELVAGTSTGGVCGKPLGRLGDSAIFGAGHWANTDIAVLCSGEGEALIRCQAASRVGARINDGNPVRESVQWGVRTVQEETGATCAIVAVQAIKNEVAAAYNGFAFPVVRVDGAGTRVIPAERIVSLT